MTNPCPYLKECRYYKHLSGQVQEITGYEASDYCGRRENSSRCRRAMYHAVYNDDPPLIVLPVSNRSCHGVYQQPSHRQKTRV